MIPSTSTLALLHIVLALLAGATGTIALCKLLAMHRWPHLDDFFLLLAALSVLLGFLPAFRPLCAQQMLGIAAAFVLAPTAIARQRYARGGLWRALYSGGITLLVYLNVLIGTLQAFANLDALGAFTPASSISATALAVLAALFVLLGASAVLLADRSDGPGSAG